MEPPKAVVPVGAVRERVVQTLTEAFANDVLTVAELEERLEKAYRAQSADEAMSLIAGLPQRAAAVAAAATSDEQPAAGLARQRERFVSIMGSQGRRGAWVVPRALDVVGFWSDTTIDLTQATLPRDIIELHVSVVMASMRIIVPPGMYVENRVGSFAANVDSEHSLALAHL